MTILQKKLGGCIIITNCDKSLLQITTAKLLQITTKFYYKLRQLIYYKLRQLLQITSEQGAVVFFTKFKINIFDLSSFDLFNFLSSL